MDVTSKARNLFRSAERRAAADFGIEMSERILPIGEPVGQARVIESGSGRPVLFVHGGGGIANHWFPLMAHLDGYRLIAVDRPGCGLTDGFDYSRTDSLRQHAVTFLARVADTAGFPTVDVVANSMGALWSLWLAADRPERVRSLSLLGCPALVAGTSAPLAMRIVSLRGLGWLLERPASDRASSRQWPGSGTAKTSPARFRPASWKPACSARTCRVRAPLGGRCSGAACAYAGPGPMPSLERDCAPSRYVRW